MTKKQYINRVAKHLKCVPARKKEIRKQLDSHIEIALGEGRNLEDVLAKMGDPKALAGEFNESLTDEETVRAKKRKKIFVIIGVILVVLALAGGFFYWWLPKGRDISTSRIFDAEEVEARSEEIARLFGDEDFETLDAYLSEEVRAALQETKPEEIKSLVGENWGDFCSLGNVYMVEIREKGQSYALVQLSAAYTNISVTFTITYRENMEVYGLYIK